MALQTFVKIANITNLSDARYCAGMGVDMLGFPIDPTNPDSLSPEAFNEIVGWVSGPKFLGELGAAGIEDIKNAIVTYNLDAIEISKIDLVEPAHLLGKSIVVRLQIDRKDDISNLKSRLSYLDELATAVVINASDPAFFDELDDLLKYHSGNLRLVKAYGVTVENASQLPAFQGIELTAVAEERPGFKDYGVVMDILEVLEID